VITGEEDYYGRAWSKENEAWYITAGNGSDDLNHEIFNLNHGKFVKGLTYGSLTIWSSSEFTYKQKELNGKEVDSFTYSEQAEKKKSNQRIMAIVILVCSLMFLCYFIYSWLSCYLKKPRISRGADPMGYPMESMRTNF